jgi:TonB family protein
MSTLPTFLTRVKGLAGSLLVHGALAAIACVSLTKVTGGGRGGQAGGDPGAPSIPGFSAAFHPDEPRVDGQRTPDAFQFDRVSDDQPVEIDLQRPVIPFDAFAVPFPGETLPLPDPSLPADPSTARFSSDFRRARLPQAQAGEAGSRPGPIGVGPSAGSGTGKSTGDGSGEGAGPVQVYGPRPDYPREARRQSIEGVVVVELSIHADGSCSVNRILQSSGSPVLDEAVVGTVATWKYKPATEGGRPVTTIERIRFVFQLSK